MNCPLCNSERTKEYANWAEILYIQCEHCLLVFKNIQHFPTEKAEKERYLLHENDVNDLNFQKFVSPIVNRIAEAEPKNHKGLDFGAGTGPVITKLLQDQGYEISLYDPFFYPDKSVLDTTFDFIICCEVMEHFHHPAKEFSLLRKLLKPQGNLYCKTQFLPKRSQFETWWYKNDNTHVAFYSEENLMWIKKEFGFSEVIIQKDLIVFEG
ncbi:class I SAM-dependent methyltransferase [Ulvibacter antarcticus]|uniref:Methyltransferase family protein n=1 Tax=Ulvibacter antarcticus TaxID=442714 RepID=A0A3L9YKC6_9FLAO|nr:class I SAM-dependent methyltransferase [Ulvibacter antarcticus]RMA58575.1 methyltransferase family protein [Ulvibacter antarcticus]